MTGAFGLDLSHHDTPDWEAVKASGCAFAYVRLTYGATVRDHKALEHLSALTALGIPFGGYHFFRSHQDWVEQDAAFVDVARAVGYAKTDLVPALFIERDPLPAPGRQPAHWWSEQCRRFTRSLERRFGGCLIYIGADDWWMMGAPSWMLKRRLWVPRLVDDRVSSTTVGGEAPLIWRRRFGLLNPGGPAGHYPQPGALGHNYAGGDIPRCSRADMGSIPPPPDSGEDDAALSSSSRPPRRR